MWDLFVLDPTFTTCNDWFDSSKYYGATTKKSYELSDGASGANPLKSKTECSIKWIKNKLLVLYSHFVGTSRCPIYFWLLFKYKISVFTLMRQMAHSYH